MNTYIIDRFESGFAVCESDSGIMVDIEIKKLPKGAREGDVMIFDGNTYNIDKERTRALRAEVLELQNKLFKRKK